MALPVTLLIFFAFYINRRCAFHPPDTPDQPEAEQWHYANQPAGK